MPKIKVTNVKLNEKAKIFLIFVSDLLTKMSFLAKKCSAYVDHSILR